MSSPLIQWYPGHIAKAEKALLEQIKRVDVVLEVRDTRIPLASHHPSLNQWIGDKPRLLILNRVDAISETTRKLWQQRLKGQGETPYFTDAKAGQGVAAVAKAAQALGAHVNQRRQQRGMNPRAIRAVVIGFPNVGKSALINRLLKRRVVESAPKPGVTRQLRWVRISPELDLLDAPGVLPAKLQDQLAAVKLAICDDIGDAAYDTQRIAASFVDLLRELTPAAPEPSYLDLLTQRYQLDPGELTGESYLVALAQHRFQQDIERTARQLLTDFRRQNLGQIALELPEAPEIKSPLALEQGVSTLEPAADEEP
jgi:ribosome biogenesis GTPase A